MLYQLHHQFKDGHTDMRAQKSFDLSKSRDSDVRNWTKGVQERHPLPDGANWMICDEKSKHFVWAVDKEETT